MSKDKIRNIKVRSVKDCGENSQKEKYKFIDGDYYGESDTKKRKKDVEKFVISSKGRKRLNVTELTKKIINENIFKFLNGKLYRYIDDLGYFCEMNNHELEVIIYNSLNEKLCKWAVYYDISSIKKFICISKKVQVDNQIDTNKFEINCINGIFDLNTKKLKKHNHNKFFMNVINARFNDSYSKTDFKKSNFCKFIKKIANDDDELIMLIQEIIGYTLSNINNAKKLFIFYGVSNSGKSTLLDLIEYMIGKENISNIPLQNLIDEKYCAALYNKLANIYNELPDYGIKDLGQIKALVSESDSISARNLYGNPFSFKNKAKLIFATNNLPKVMSRTEYDNSAFFNRILIIPFENSIKKKEQNKNLLELMKKEVDLIFKWSLFGIRRYIDNGFAFSKCKVSEKYIDGYRAKEDIIGEFVKKNIILMDGEIVFWTDIKYHLEKFANERGKKYITADEYKFAKKLIEKQFDVKYKKTHTKLENRWGFKGIKLQI